MFWTDEILASNKGGVLDSATEYFRCFTPGDGASWDVYSESPACSLRDDGQRERIRRRELLLRQRRGRLCFCLDATWSRAWRFDRGHDHGGIWSSAIDDKAPRACEVNRSRGRQAPGWPANLQTLTRGAPGCIPGFLRSSRVSMHQASTGEPRMLKEVGGVNESEEHTSELQSLMRTSYAVFCLKKKKEANQNKTRLKDEIE